jgi:hypothetical protein
MGYISFMTNETTIAQTTVSDALSMLAGRGITARSVEVQPGQFAITAAEALDDLRDTLTEILESLGVHYTLGESSLNGQEATHLYVH